MSGNRRWNLMRFGLALAAVGLAALFRDALDSLVGDHSPYILFVLPVMFAGWYGGLGPALLATLLGAACGAILFTPPAGVPKFLRLNQWIQLGLFLLAGGLISFLTQMLHRAFWQLKLRSAEARRKERSFSVELRKANRAKDRFLAMLSHELRTPLTPILATVSAMENDSSIPADIRARLDIVRRNAQLEARLIDDLLDLTHISRGKLRLQLAAVSFHELVRASAQAFASREAAEKGVSLCFRLDAACDRVWADPTRLQQVIANLLRNALKFTPPGGQVQLVTHGDDAHLCFDVIDNGIGISSAALARIFDAFEQGDDGIRQRFGGLGLGLAISRGLVEAQGGTLRARSDGPDTGAVFTLELPLHHQAGPAPAAAAPDARHLPPRPLHILLVEDHEDTARVLQRLLESLGHNVEHARGVAQAISIADTHPFDLLISDLGLPDGSGADVMRHVRPSHLPGIALSGFGMDDDVRRSLQAGFIRHLTKPVEFAHLAQAIDQVLEEHARSDGKVSIAVR